MTTPTAADIEAVIAENAVLLGEEPTIAVHVLKDGRVRVYDIGLGWRRQGYREYRSLMRAYDAALVANERAKRVEYLRGSGWTTSDAVQEVISGLGAGVLA